MSKAVIQLADIVDTDSLQRLQDSFSAVTGYDACIFASEGVPVTEESGGDILSRMDICQELCEKGRIYGAPAYDQKSGLTAVPIIIDSACLGSWIIRKPNLKSGAADSFGQAEEQTRINEHLKSINAIIEISLRAGRAHAGQHSESAEMAGHIKTIQTLQATLRDAEANGAQLAIAVLNINGLAYASSAYGRTFADKLLTNAADSIRTVIRSSDIIGKMHGDMFVVVLPGCNRHLAERRIRRGQEKLIQLKASESSENFSFCFGIVENTELKFIESEEYVLKLLSIAKQRMWENKRDTEMLYAGF